jgi:hypothetical protein
MGAGVGAPFSEPLPFPDLLLPDLLRGIDAALRALERAVGELEWAVELLADEEARAAELHVRSACARLAEAIDTLSAARVRARRASGWWG